MTQLGFDLGATPTVLRMPPEPIIRSAEIEDNYRWTARRAWGAGPCIHWNLLNPSEANGDRDDPTMWRMIGFSYRWGFGSLVVTNLYPFISPNVPALKAWRSAWKGTDWVTDGRSLVWEFDKSALNAWLHNADVVREVIRGTDTHVAAWGNALDPDDVKDFLDEVSWDYDTIGMNEKHRTTGDAGVRLPVEWKCIGVKADGSPKHPLARGLHRVPDDAVLQVWRKP